MHTRLCRCFVSGALAVIKSEMNFARLLVLAAVGTYRPKPVATSEDRRRCHPENDRQTARFRAKKQSKQVINVPYRQNVEESVPSLFVFFKFNSYSQASNKPAVCGIFRKTGM